MDNEIKAHERPDAHPDIRWVVADSKGRQFAWGATEEAAWLAYEERARRAREIVLSDDDLQQVGGWHLLEAVRDARRRERGEDA